MDVRDLEARNEALGRAPEEPPDVRKAGGGVRGPSMGRAHAGRYGARPENVGNRQRKPRGADKP